MYSIIQRLPVSFNIPNIDQSIGNIAEITLKSLRSTAAKTGEYGQNVKKSITVLTILS